MILFFIINGKPSAIKSSKNQMIFYIKHAFFLYIKMKPLIGKPYTFNIYNVGAICNIMYFLAHFVLHLALMGLKAYIYRAKIRTGYFETRIVLRRFLSYLHQNQFCFKHRVTSYCE